MLTSSWSRFAAYVFRTTSCRRGHGRNRRSRIESLETRTLLTAGALDTSFDVDGTLTTAIGALSDVAGGIAIQSDGKIVVAGYSDNGSNIDFALTRYNTDGSLDTTFDVDGKLTTEIGTSNDIAQGLAIQSDGKIVVVGYSHNGSDNDFALARYNSDGSLDVTFDGDGKLTTAIGTSADVATSVSIQSDGKIVAAGYSVNGSIYDFALTRYNANGSLDPSFGVNGRLTTSIGASEAIANSVAIQSDGKIVAAGYSHNGSNRDFALARYNTNGTLDTSFDGDGTLTTAFGALEDVVNSVAIQTDGRIVVAGYTVNGGKRQFALARYFNNGALDWSFGASGRHAVSFSPSHSVATSLAIQSDGRIVAAGSANNGSNNDFAMIRFNTNGGLDYSFDGDGIVTTDFGSTNDVIHGVAIQSDDKIVVTGYRNNGSTDVFALARYIGALGPTDLALSETFILEHQPVGTVVGTLMTTDPDVSDTFTYSLVFGTGSGDNASFSIDGDKLKSNASFDYETNPGYAYRIRVRTTDQTGRWFEKPLMIQVSDLYAGLFDKSLDFDGKLTTAIGASLDIADSMAVQSDGRIVVAGRSYNGSNADFALIRYNADGTLDTSFDGDGKLTTDFSGNSEDVARSVSLQSDGRIVVAGYSYNGFNYDFALIRYNTDGTLDTSFDGDGKLTTDFYSTDDIATSVSLQSDGRIVVAGYTYNGFSYDFALIRYNADGTLDTSFDGDGKLTTNFSGNSEDFARSVSLQSDGRIVVAGYSYNGSNSDFALIRYNADGTLDTSFDGDGKLTTNFSGNSGDHATGVSLQSDGRIVVAGYTYNGSNADFALIRFNTDGTLDTSFDGDGKLTTNVSGTDDIATGMSLQSDGRIVVAGYSYNGFNYDFALIRYNTDGTLDTSFDGDGKLTTDFSSTDDIATGVAIQSDGRIVVAGYSHDGTNHDFALIRYEGTSEPIKVALSSSAIQENQPVGAVVGILTTTDPDGLDTFSYALVAGVGSIDNGSFFIVGDRLVSNTNVDYETQSSYSVRIRTTDQTGKWFEKVFTISVTNVTELRGIDVQNGQTQRSYVRYLDVLFDQPNDLMNLINNGRLQLTKRDLNGLNPSIMSLPTRSVFGNNIRLDFGVQGIGGNRNTNAGDGYYEMAVDMDGNGTFESTKYFYRLLGDVNGDRKVDATDSNLTLAAFGSTNAERDVNGDGFVNANDRTLVLRALGRKLKDDLFVND